MQNIQEANKEMAKQQLAKDVLNMRFAILKKLYILGIPDQLDNIWRWVVHDQKEWIFRGNIVHDIILNENVSGLDSSKILSEANKILKKLMTPTDGLKVVSKSK